MAASFGKGINAPRALWLICIGYLLLAATFASSSLDIDEFTFIREPYEMLGGDYTRHYVREGDWQGAVSTAAKSYYFFWKYRPMFSPIIDTQDRDMFREQEERFGYVRPDPVRSTGGTAQTAYGERLIVPEPDRWFSHGAGKPLLAAVLSVPQLALVNAASSQNLLVYQFGQNYHPIFVLTRLVQLLAGLLTIVLVYRMAAAEYGTQKGLLAAALLAFFPTTIKYFPNIHHDSLLVPFALLATHYFARGRHVWTGVWLGLAFATKNTTIFLVAAFALVAVWESLQEPREQRWQTLLRRSRGLAVAGGVALLVLLPFANPVSYVREIATPITHRATDPRGENVESFSVAARINDQTVTEGRSLVRPEVQLSRLLLRLNSTDFFLWVIALLMLVSYRQHTSLSRLALAVIVMAAPYGIVFGDDVMMYRALLFLPFFALLAAAVAQARPLLVLVGALVLFDLVYAIDPITTDRIHMPADGRSLLHHLAP